MSAVNAAYRHRDVGRRGCRVIINASAKPMPPAINNELSGFSCTLFAIACEPSRNVSLLFP
jgi:hypothetical protein